MYIYIYIYTNIRDTYKPYRDCWRRRAPASIVIMMQISYTQSPSQDSRLFGPRPWKILALIV